MGVMFTNLAIVWGPRIVPTESYRKNKLLILRIPGYSPLIKYGNAKCTSFLHGGFLSHGGTPCHHPIFKGFSMKSTSQPLG